MIAYSLNNLNPAALTDKDLLSESEWLDIIEIIDLLGFDVKLNQRSKKNQKFLWYILNLCQYEVTKKGEKILRHLENLFHELKPGDKNRQVYYKVLRMMYFFDCDFYSFKFAPYRGLKQFLQRIKGTYGQQEKLLSELKFFNYLAKIIIQKKDMFLINEYTYLQNISLPKTGYEDLQKDLDQMLNCFRKIDSIIFSKQRTANFLSFLRNFKNTYLRIYIREHDRYQKKINNFYDQLSAMPEYNYLQKQVLNKREKELQTYLNNFFPGKCEEQDLKQLLEKQPECNCGFSLQKYQIIPSVDKITPLLKKEVNFS